MNINEAVKQACKKPTLLDALSWICVWESERVVKQAKKNLRDADGKGWDTCFKICLGSVMREYGRLKNPVIEESLWTNCLFELMAKAKREGKQNVEFKDVDDLVLEKSKQPLNQT